MGYSNTKIVLLGMVLSPSPIRTALQGMKLLDQAVRNLNLPAAQELEELAKVHNAGRAVLVAFGVPKGLAFDEDLFYQEAVEKAGVLIASFLGYDENNCEHHKLLKNAEKLDKGVVNS